MLDVYWGEMLVSPFPLELSLNSCSHGCSYCFARLNNGDYRESPERIMRLLADYHNRETLQATLLQQGYAVVVSNRMDPFGESNHEQVLPMLRTMVAAGIPVMIQTKGGNAAAIDEALSFLPPSTWYVTVAVFDEALREKIEPNAPPISERLDLIEKLASKGHTVIWGYNPLQPEWSPQPEAMFAEMVNRGVRGVWIEILHLNYRQVARMTERERAAITEPIIKRAQKRNAPQEMWDHLYRAYDASYAVGLPHFSLGQPYPTELWDVARAPYKKAFPLLQDFVNWCYANRDDGDVITCADWLAALNQWPLPQGTYKLHHYIGATAHNVFWDHKVPLDLTYNDLLRVYWQEPRCSQWPGNIPCFGYLEKDGKRVLDDDGLPLMVFGGGIWSGR